jgi:UDP-N-acetylmuramoyl-tripeptide--D-alanyl-D-alanine ligase
MQIAQAAQALEVRYQGPDVEFTGVSTDSRQTKRGDLFVAIKGDRYDGHAYVAQAAAAGAVAAVVANKSVNADASTTTGALPLLHVDDTLVALGRLAGHWRRRFEIPLVALTGSNGKTTVKEMLAAILRAAVESGSSTVNADAQVLATQGNLNNHIGVPLTLLRLRSVHRYAVVEMGMNHAGEIGYVSRMAAPDVALINNAGSAHIENFGATDRIARAKGEIFEGLKPLGTAVINADDAYAALWRELASAYAQTDFALRNKACVTATYRLRRCPQSYRCPALTML